METRSYNTRCKEILFISIKVTYYSLIILVIFAFGPKLLVYTHTLIHIPYNPAFLHMTVLCCLQFPPSLRQIYIYCIFLGVREERKRERGKAYCTIIGVFAQIGKRHRGHFILGSKLTTYDNYRTDTVRDTQTAALLQHHNVLYSRDCLLYRNRLLCTRDSSLHYTYFYIYTYRSFTAQLRGRGSRYISH